MIGHRRRDATHKALRKLFRDLGATWVDTADTPGSLDGLLGHAGLSVLVEIKDGRKPPSKRTLTDFERKTIETWRGFPCAVVSSEEEALTLVHAVGTLADSLEVQRMARQHLARISDVFPALD